MLLEGQKTKSLDACLWSFGAFSNLPALDLILAGSEEVNEANRFETGRDDFRQRTRGLALHKQVLVLHY